jgi:D-amino-acid dehydrogenase
MSKSYVVIGGGITGVTTAYCLAKKGFTVTLIEKNRYPGMEISYANGGQLSASNAEVWTHPSTIIKGLKWMFKSDAPLLMNPTPTWHKLSWSDKKSFDHAGEVSKLLAQGGLKRRAVTPIEMKAIEPTLHGKFYGGYFTESDSTGDIHKFTYGLAKACERIGVTILNGHEVLSVAANGKSAFVQVKHAGDTDSLTFDGIVICAGVHGRRLAAQLGDRLTIYPVKGYSITVNLPDSVSQAAAPHVSLLDDETKLVTSRLGDDRFRVAGTAEFNGINLDIRADRIQPLIQWVNQCFPEIDTRKVVPWAGLRPMMPTMMPRVGRGSRPNVFYNTGHGHLGWTLSAVTAEMVTELMQQHRKSAALGAGSGKVQ